MNGPNNDIICPACRTGRKDAREAVQFARLQEVILSQADMDDFRMRLCPTHRDMAVRMQDQGSRL